MPPKEPSMNQLIDNPIQTSAPRLLVMVVHGTFPRGGWLQLRRNWLAFWARVRRQTIEEESLWPSPAPLPSDKTPPNQRHWFEAGSALETMSLEIYYQAQLKGLNHSLYEADVVRQRIATWFCALVDQSA
jgi:hypothetical protein